MAASNDKIKEGSKAGNLTRAIASAINDGGGGRPNPTQVGGRSSAGIKEALSQARDYLDKQIKNEKEVTTSQSKRLKEINF